MRLFNISLFIGKRKDGGPKSHVTGYFFEIKSLFTLALLRFDNGTREAFHSHAFNCISWVIKGKLLEQFYDLTERLHITGKVLVTRREDLHRVESIGTSWVLTLRGPWQNYWWEVVPRSLQYDKLLMLATGREVCWEYPLFSKGGRIRTEDVQAFEDAGLALTAGPRTLP
jgi:hypothetical protein